MKSNLLIALVATILVLFSSCNQAQSRTSDDGAVKMLKSFYTAYITEGLQDTFNESKVASLEKKHCTARLLNKIKKIQDDGELDSDPFLNAQDVDKNWLKTLSVQKDTKKQNGYMVSYISEYNKTTTTIRLSLVKEGENYKIDDIAGL